MFSILRAVFLSRGAPPPNPPAGALTPAPPPGLRSGPPSPRTISHLLHELTQAAKFHVLIEKNNIRTSRRKCSCKLAWGSRYSIELIAIERYRTREWQPEAEGRGLSAREITRQLHVRLHSLTFASLRVMYYFSTYIHFFSVSIR